MAESSKFKLDETVIMAHVKPNCDHTNRVETMRVIPKSDCAVYTITCTCGSYITFAVNNAKDSLSNMNKVRRLLYDKHQ